jgi:hypothetical protein
VLADPEEQIEGANPAASLPHSQIRGNLDDPGFARQETVMTRSGPPSWPGEAKGKGRKPSLGPDDSISQVPRRDGLRQSSEFTELVLSHAPFIVVSASPDPQSIEEEALLPPHVYAPTSRRQSMRSPESRHSGGSIPTEEPFGNDTDCV